MTRNEMLAKLGLSDNDFNDLLGKFRNFYGTLNASQQAVVNRMMPKAKRTAAILGGNPTATELTSFITPAPSGAAAFTQNGLNQITNPDPNAP